MFDFKFEWQKSLETGNEDLDTQHKQLFSIGRNINVLLRRDCIGVTDQELLDIVCGLRDFLAYHFYVEEALMKDICYGKFTEHVKYHKRCSDYVMKIDVPKLKANPKEGLQAIRDELQEWVLNHVLSEDAHMAQAAKKYYEEEAARKERKKMIPNEELFGEEVAKLDVSKVYLYKNQTCRGHVVLVSTGSAKEFTKLTNFERTNLISDLLKASNLIKKLYQADSVSYMNLEDMDGRIAFHLIPKYRDEDTYGQLVAVGKEVPATDAVAYQKIKADVMQLFK